MVTVNKVRANVFLGAIGFEHQHRQPYNQVF